MKLPPEYSPLAMRPRSGVCSDRGLVRPANEDAYLLRELPWSGGGLVVAVADGMGGFGPGLLASREALEELYEALAHPLPRGHREPLGPERLLREAVRRANETLYAAAVSDGRRVGTGTTLTVCWILADECLLAHVGDSRAYCLRRGELRLLTEDHSLRNLMLRHGEEELPARSFPPLRLLGTHASVPVDQSVAQVRAGDRLLLATDGITDVVPDGVLSRWLREAEGPDEAARAVVAGALEMGSRDNATALVVDLGAAATLEEEGQTRPGFTTRTTPGMIPSGKVAASRVSQTAEGETQRGIRARDSESWTGAEHSLHDLPGDRAPGTRSGRPASAGRRVPLSAQGLGIRR